MPNPLQVGYVNPPPPPPPPPPRPPPPGAGSAYYPAPPPGAASPLEAMRARMAQSARQLVRGPGVYEAQLGYNLAELQTPAELPEQRAEGSVLDYAFWCLVRFRHLLTVAPCTASLLLIRWGLWSTSPPAVYAIDSTVLPPTITAVVFVMSTVFSNVISDYKESEKIPAELVSYFQVIINTALGTLNEGGHVDHRPLLREVETMLLCVMSTVDRAGRFEENIRLFNRAGLRLCAQLRRNGVHEMETVEHAMTEIQKKWTRIHDIGRLSIILAGYTLMDSLCIILIAVLLCVKYANNENGFWVLLIFGSVCLYLNLLVRTLDDPFDGPEHYHFKCYVHETPVNKTFWEGWKFSTAVRTHTRAAQAATTILGAAA